MKLKGSGGEVVIVPSVRPAQTASRGGEPDARRAVAHAKLPRARRAHGRRRRRRSAPREIEPEREERRNESSPATPGRNRRRDRTPYEPRGCGSRTLGTTARTRASSTSTRAASTRPRRRIRRHQTDGRRRGNSGRTRIAPGADPRRNGSTSGYARDTRVAVLVPVLRPPGSVMRVARRIVSPRLAVMAVMTHARRRSGDGIGRRRRRVRSVVGRGISPDVLPVEYLGILGDGVGAKRTAVLFVAQHTGRGSSGGGAASRGPPLAVGVDC